MTEKNPIPPVALATQSLSSQKPIPGISSGAHELECLVQRSLQACPGLKFTRLTVHQCAQGVCLEGLLESNEEGIDLCEFVNEVAGVNVINHVVNHLEKTK